MENSKIEWTDHTFNPWTGCEKVSPACANCYAEAWAKRCGRDFKTRIRTKTWGEPVKWNRLAEIADNSWNYMRRDLCTDDAELIARGFMKPARPRVFCASLADWLDDSVPLQWLADLLQLIRETPHLDWLLLTKRPENFDKRVGEALYLADEDTKYWLAEWSRDEPPYNVWIGVTAENQGWADKRIPLLFDIPARVRFLSIEPMLGPVELSAFMGECITPMDVVQKYNFGIDWIICGGESGSHARPMNPIWASDLQWECGKVDVPFLFKQWGEWGPVPGMAADAPAVRSGKVIRFESGHCMERVGKKKAGRVLNCRTWDDLPLVNMLLSRPC